MKNNYNANKSRTSAYTSIGKNQSNFREERKSSKAANLQDGYSRDIKDRWQYNGWGEFSGAFLLDASSSGIDLFNPSYIVP